MTKYPAYLRERF